MLPHFEQPPGRMMTSLTCGVMLDHPQVMQVVLMLEFGATGMFGLLN